MQKKEASTGKSKESKKLMGTDYNRDMVRFSIMKKYDPKLTADQ